MDEELLSHPESRAVGPFPRSHILFRENTPCANVFCLRSGVVKVSRQGSNGRAIIVCLYGPGDFLGVNEVLRGAPWSATATVAQDAIVQSIPAHLFRSICQSNGHAWRWFAGQNERTMECLQQRLEVLNHAEAGQRILALLPYLASKCASLSCDGFEAIIPLKQEDIASLVGATRETTSSLLNTFARAGLVELRRGKLLIPSLRALQAHV